ncbi:MAG: type I methionyl aminopeptidase [Patescibacteria group bacterium]|nr:type I methionyl aminopeptidase [Patescibacteria group bacterium]
MISLKTPKQINILREGGRRLATILQTVGERVKPGVTPLELDAMARDLIKQGGDEPSFLNYRPAGASGPYPAALCVSVNESIVHGIPDKRSLQEGDIVGIDLGLKHKGLYTDMAMTVSVGELKPELKRLLAHTKEGLRAGIAQSKVGNHLGDIGAAIEAVAEKHGYGVVRELAGHGVGLKVHEEPEVPNYGQVGTGLKLKAGIVIAIEPMFNLGAADVVFHDDGYTVTTKDKLPSAHFEHTVLVTESGGEVLTRS